MKRYMYSMAHQVATFGKIGQLLPFCSMEVAPGDSWQGKFGQLVRLSPLKRALLQDMYVDTFLFYIPHRMVWAEFENFITWGPDAPGSTNPHAPPTITITDTQGDMDHLFQPKPTETGTARTYSALRNRAYNLCFNEYFLDRDQSMVQPDSTGMQRVYFKKDYWSNLNSQLQKEAATFHSAEVQNPGQSGANVRAQDIIQAVAQHRISVKRATYGSRYLDVLKSYGVRINYQMLQRPELLAIGRGAINVTDVVATDSSTEANLGKLAGHGISGKRIRLRRRSFPEHGTLLGLMVVRPVHADAEFLDWFDRKRTYNDYYDPGLNPLPPRAVTREDIVAINDSVPGAGDTVGYWPQNHWYRKGMSRIRNGLEDWTGSVVRGEDFRSITKDSISRVTPAKYDSLFNDNTYGHYQVSSVNLLKAVRSVPKANMSLATGMPG